MVSGRVLACGMVVGGALSLPLWLLLNACVLSLSLGVPVKDAVIVVPAALAAIALSLAIGPVAAGRAGAVSIRDGTAAGLTAGLAAAVPVLLLVVPGAAALALGVLPLVAAGDPGGVVPVSELARPVAVQTMWAGPLFALMPVLWLALVGGLSGGAFGLVDSFRRTDPGTARAVTAAL